MEVNDWFVRDGEEDCCKCKCKCDGVRSVYNITVNISGSEDENKADELAKELYDRLSVINGVRRGVGR